MLEDKDIQKLVYESKGVLTTKEDFINFKDELRRSVSDIMNSIDAYSRKTDRFFEEISILSQKIDRYGKLIQQIADKK